MNTMSFISYWGVWLLITLPTLVVLELIQDKVKARRKKGKRK